MQSVLTIPKLTKPRCDMTFDRAAYLARLQRAFEDGLRNAPAAKARKDELIAAARRRRFRPKTPNDPTQGHPPQRPPAPR